MLINRDMKAAVVRPTEAYLPKISLFLRYCKAVQKNLLQLKQDQLALKQDQLFKLMPGERSTGLLPHMFMAFLSPSPRPSPGFSRRTSVSPH